MRIARDPFVDALREAAQHVHLEAVASVSAGDLVAEKYRVERLLGRGGMGYVVAARHLTLDQLVAIKFLRKTALSDDEALARFRREAKAWRASKNEHIATVFDVGARRRAVIVMEHLEGADLGAMTRGDGKDSKVGRALAIAESCDFILQACEALAEAHSLGIVHRDIKLPNLFVTQSARSGSKYGLLKVLDFGVSKTVAEQGDVTQTAAVLGSPKYMSPEQMNDPRNVDGRTDIWSLGVCLYRLMSGYAPFDGDTIGRLCTMVLHETPVRLRDLRSDVPPVLDAVVQCCLQKDRAYRFANVAELAAALVPFTSSPEQSAERLQHIATVLQLNSLPPIGYLPAPPPAPAPSPSPTPLFHTSAPGLEGPAAWAHTMVEQRREKRKSELTLVVAMSALLLALLVVGFAVFVRRNSGDELTAASASVPAPPSVATVIATPTPSATNTALIPITAPSAITVAAVTPASSTTTTTPTPTRAIPAKSHTHGAASGKSPSQHDADGPPLPIPGDRK